MGKLVSIILLVLLCYGLYDFHTYHYHNAKWNFWLGKYAYSKKGDEEAIQLVMRYHAERCEYTLTNSIILLYNL